MVLGVQRVGRVTARPQPLRSFARNLRVNFLASSAPHVAYPCATAKLTGTPTLNTASDKLPPAPVYTPASLVERTIPTNPR
jgi:hypothetical protein